MQIPTNPFYDIDENAVVRLISSWKIVPEYRNHKGKRAVKIRGKSHKPSSHSLDRLMLLAFKPLPDGKDPEWLSVRYVDGNRDNLNIINLEWSDAWYRPNIPTEVSNIWYGVYGDPILEIKLSPHGVLLRRSDNWNEIGVHNQNGYLAIKHPITRATIGLHRLVALTFLPHPVDTDHLTVNHKDSVKNNNWPYNLEWATHSQNNFHAYSEGPRGETVRKIRLKHLATGQEVVVAGYNELARYLGVLPGSAHSALDRRRFEGRPYKGHVLKYDDDPRTWEELAASGPRDKRVAPERIACKNMKTGVVTIYDSFREMMRVEEINEHAAYRLLSMDPPIPWRGKCFQEAREDRPLRWPKYPEAILKVYENFHSSDKPIGVTAPDGSVRYYTKVTAWCMEDRDNRCDPAVISRHMKKSKGKACRWRDWVFEYIDLRRYLQN